MKRALNVKQMLSVYRSAATDDVQDDLWEAFLVLRDHHFITDHEWKRFYDITYQDWLAEDPTMED